MSKQKFEGGKTYHVCLSIAGALKQSNASLDGVLGDGRRIFSGSEAKIFLRRQRDENGYSHYAGCDNMDKDGRCAGHPII